MSDLEQKVIYSVSDSLSVDESEIQNKTRLITDLDADSLDIMDIMFKLEEEFDIKLEKEDFDFLKKIDMDREEAVVDGVLTKDALKRLKDYLPELETEKPLKPAELGSYLTINALNKLVQSKLDNA